MLNQASDVCGELDRSITMQATWLYTDHRSLLALAQGAKNYNFSRPSITRNNVIQIKGMSTFRASIPNPDFFASRKSHFKSDRLFTPSGGFDAWICGYKKRR